MANGYITIGTELKTDKFDRQLASLEKKMQTEEKKKVELGFDLKEQEFINAKKQYDDLNKKVDEYKRKLETLKEMPRIAKEQGQEVKPLWKYLEDLQATKASYGQAIEQLQKQEAVMYRINGEYQKQKQQVDAINEKIADYKQKAESIRFNKQQAEIEQVRRGFDKVGGSIESAVKKAGRMVLSIIGIRTGLAMLRSASSTLAGYDEQYSANLEYIRFALAEMIAPVLKYIVELVATILQYVNAIVSAWFGINLFSNASAKNFQKMKAGAGGTAKAVKEIKKQLAGFDEINMLTDNASSSGGGSAGGVSPSFDLGADVQIPKWLQWIIDNKDLILAILTGIAAAIVAIKLGLSGIKALGIGLVIGGVVKLIQDLMKYLEASTWENFGKIIQDIGVIIIGFGVIIGSIPAIVVGVLTLIIGYIVKHWEEIKEKVKNGLDWLKSKTDWVREHFGIVGEIIYRTVVKYLESAWKFINTIVESIKKIFDGFINFITGVFTGDWKKAWDGVSSIFGGFVDIISGAIDWVSSFVTDIWDSVIDTISSALNIDTYTGEANSLKEWWDNFVNSLTKIITLKFDIFGNFSLGGGGGAGGGGSSGRALGAIYFPPKMKLWTGGIINMPGRGVPLGTNIGGERGAEGVIPLTQNQAMEALGYEIGKNVTVNLTNITEMNGRIIGRELKKVKSQQDFAFNS